MVIEPATLARFGAWGQICVVGLAVACWSLDSPAGLLVAGVGYLVVTMVGITGMSRAESGIAGTLVYPFLLPGLLPLYYFATR
jgi:hypothetical protein